MSLWAVVPARSFATAKSRLNGAMTVAERTDFARELFTHLLDVVAGCRRIERVVVVTDADAVEVAAKDRGAEVIRDSDLGGDREPELEAVVDHGLVYAADRGATAAVVLMADLPWISATDLDAFLDACPGRDVVVAADLGGEGTSALYLSPPRVMRNSFGGGTSFLRHVTRAREHGLDVAAHYSAGLGFDVDTPADLERLRGKKPRRRHARR